MFAFLMCRLTIKNTLLITAALLIFQVITLWIFGQPFVCECGYVKVFESVVQSEGNSQHLFDWYTPSHIIHGILFFALLSWLFPKQSLYWRFIFALLLEIGWEIIENTPMVIDHYRKQALAQGYVGDSILNSVSDSVAMIVGFVLATKVPVWLLIIGVIGLELLTVYSIRDGLLFNIINLIYPIPILNEWQSAIN